MLTWLLVIWILLSFTLSVALGLIAGSGRGEHGARRPVVEVRDGRLN